MEDENILNIAKRANLKLSVDNKVLTVKQTISFKNKSTWGVLFFLFGGLFLITAPLIKISDNTTKVIGVVLGLLLVFITILTLIRQVADGLQIKDKTILFRNNLKKTIIPINDNQNVIFKTELLRIRRESTLGSDFILVTLFLNELNEEKPILKFQMDNFDSDIAKKLGFELTKLINAKLKE